jgi:hypothetical protein
MLGSLSCQASTKYHTFAGLYLPSSAKCYADFQGPRAGWRWPVRGKREDAVRELYLALETGRKDVKFIEEVSTGYLQQSVDVLAFTGGRRVSVPPA